MPMQNRLGTFLCVLLAATVAAHGAEPGELIFQDNFDGRLADGWSWEREDRATWRVGTAGLEVRVQPGNMWGAANNAKNVLVRPIPAPTDTPVEISVTFSNAPTAQWEQANLVWFYDDSYMVKLGQELVTGRFSIVMGREENDRARTVAIIPLDDHTVELRLQAFHNRIRGQFRTHYWSEWRDVGECDLPVKGEPKASLHFYNGPPNEEHWIKANNFTVRRLKPESVNWPRVRTSENIYRVSGSSMGATDIARLSLGDGKFVLVNDPTGLAGKLKTPDGDRTAMWAGTNFPIGVVNEAKADCEQRIFRHQDGSCGWSWDRRSSTSKQPVLVGIGFGRFDLDLFIGDRFSRFDLDRRITDGFSTTGFYGAEIAKPLEMELNAVTRLENDQGDRNLSVHLWLAIPPSAVFLERGLPGPTHRISILFDWYGKEATGQPFNDGYRDYEYVEPKSVPADGPVHCQYRLKGFRGGPPKVNLQAFVVDAHKRGMWKSAGVVGVWFGNEVWDGSRGGTLVTKLDLVIDGKRYSAVPALPPDSKAK